jgi:predicted enzyme related to lactoylglutathione lyase
MSLIGQFRPDHMDLVVKDWAVMLSFYSELFGVTADVIEVRQPGIAVQIGVSDANTLSRVAIFRLPGGFRFHFHHFPDICAETELRHCARYMPGHSNLALSVEDIDAAYLSLKNKGVVFLGPPVTLEIAPLVGARFVMFDDPEGNTVELVQRPQGWDIERHL